MTEPQQAGWGESSKRARKALDAAAKLGGKIWKSRSKIRAAGTSAVREFAREGAQGAIDSVSYLLFSEKAQEELLKEERGLRGEYKSLVLSHPERWRSLDTITVGGLLLSEILAARSVPPEIEAAYTAAFPDLAATRSISESVSAFDSDQLPGLLAGIKGKLFELRYVDLLNKELLPDGYVAELATSATQPGWDIAVAGPDGSVSGVLQAKATDSASYVREALERYPEIDVVTTDEVYSQLLLSGPVEDLIPSGISNAALEESVLAAADSTVEFDFSPPLLGLAVVGFTTFAFEEGGVGHKARVLGTRCGRLYPAWMVGKAIAAFSGPLWWLSIPAGMGVRYVAEAGRARRRRWADLFRRVRSYRKVLARYRPGEGASGPTPATS